MLPGLKTRPGLHTWPVLTGTARFKGVKTPRAGAGKGKGASDATAAKEETAAAAGEEAIATDGAEGEGGSAASGAAAVAAAVDSGKKEEEAKEEIEKEGGDNDKKEGEGGGVSEEFPEPAVASETPLEDAVKAGLRHHPSFKEVDTATTRK